MPRYSAEQIYAFARQAGFSPDEATTMTAIALAESGGNSRAHNPYGEDSKGLWQINARAHPDLAGRYNLYDPADNAKAAFEVSHHGGDISPWTVTHGGSSARYLRYRADAEQAAVANGDGRGLGVWTGTPGYGNKVAAGGDEEQANAALDRFLSVAKQQIGDRYVFGHEAKLSDTDPGTFDCSEFTQWAAHQAGVKIPDGATAQYLYFKQRGMLVPIEEGKTIPGALLFHFDREPRPGDGRTPGAHVAISLGDGDTVEARNSRDGVGQWAAGKRFQYAAVIPGISDGTATPPAEVEPPPALLDQTPPGGGVAPMLGGADTDHDGLTDAMESRLGLDALRADTDGDNLSDSYELVTSKTDPRQADTDGDRLNDAFELARGLDPTAPDSDGDGHLDGSFSSTHVDTDQDALDDELERALGLDPSQADSDADGFGDALEVQTHSNPLDPHSSPLAAVDDPLGPDAVQPTPTL